MSVLATVGREYIDLVFLHCSIVSVLAAVGREDTAQLDHLPGINRGLIQSYDKGRPPSLSLFWTNDDFNDARNTLANRWATQSLL